jgi:hypothetical protein
MKSLLLSAVLVAGAPAVLAQEKEVFFEVPAGVSDLERLKVAKTLAIRCAAAGLKDIVADLHRPAPNEPKRIRLISKDRFWTDQFPLLDFLATFQARKLEIQFHRVVQPSERTVFKEGEKAPVGFAWVKFPEWKFSEKPFPHYQRVENSHFLLLPEKPKPITGPFKIVRHAGGDLFGVESDPAILMVFKGPQALDIDSRKVRNPEGEGHILPMNLFIDDVYFSESNGMMLWRYAETKSGSKPELALWKFDELDARTPLVWLLENPLPFQLKRVKQE